MALEMGSIVTVNLTGKEIETGSIVETTLAEEAKKAGLYNKKDVFQPLTVVVGAQELMPGLDKALTQMSKGESKTLRLEPEEAFGERNPKNIAIVPTKEFKKREMMPFPGLVIELNGQTGKVQTVSGGRVRVDFNHPLAGKSVEYTIKVEEVFTSKKEKVEALYLKFFPKAKKEDVLLEQKTVKAVSDKGHPNAQILEKLFEEYVKKHIEKIEKVEFVNELKPQKPKKKAKEGQKKP